MKLISSFSQLAEVIIGIMEANTQIISQLEKPIGCMLCKGAHQMQMYELIIQK